MIEQLVIYSYAALVAIGGIVGYLKAKSIPSLVMGLLFGALLLATGLYMNKNYNAAFCTALGLSGFLTLFFAYRYFLSKNFMPGGLMAVISLIVLATIALLHSKH